LASRPQVENNSPDPLFRTAAETALRAVQSCQPIRLPAARYEVWRNVQVDFDPTQM
jgi:colicin import membrane protein